jgi:hypothetical protein
MWQARDLLTTRVADATERRLLGRSVGVEAQNTSSGDLMSGEYDMTDELSSLIERTGG